MHDIGINPFFTLIYISAVFFSHSPAPDPAPCVGRTLRRERRMLSCYTLDKCGSPRSEHFFLSKGSKSTMASTRNTPLSGAMDTTSIAVLMAVVILGDFSLIYR